MAHNPRHAHNSLSFFFASFVVRIVRGDIGGCLRHSVACIWVDVGRTMETHLCSASRIHVWVS